MLFRSKGEAEREIGKGKVVQGGIVEIVLRLREMRNGRERVRELKGRRQEFRGPRPSDNRKVTKMLNPVLTLK